MQPGQALFGRFVPALVAAGAALAATWFVRDRAVRPTAPRLDDLVVHEEVATRARDLPPYLTGDLDGDGVPEVVLRAGGPAGPALAVLAHHGAIYDEVGRVPLASAPIGCPTSVTLEDGTLLVTSYAHAPWAATGCAPVRRAYYRVHEGRLVRVGLVDDER